MHDPRGSSRRKHALRDRLGAALLASALSLLGAAAARGAGTSPGLALTMVTAAPVGGGERVLTASGSYNFDDLVQVAFPAAGLLLIQGDRFVRYEVDGTVIAATSALVKNGLTPSELPELLQLAGSPAGAPRITRLAAGEVSVLLPADLATGPALAVLYALHEDESFLSNAIPVVLP